MRACRIASKLGFGGSPAFFSPVGLPETEGLEEGEGDHGHERVSVQPFPRSALEVIQAEIV